MTPILVRMGKEKQGNYDFLGLEPDTFTVFFAFCEAFGSVSLGSVFSFFGKNRHMNYLADTFK
jgi:hypothetical protein